MIKSSEILAELESMPIESDIGLSIIQSLDNHYRKIYAKEIERKRARK